MRQEDKLIEGYKKPINKSKNMRIIPKNSKPDLDKPDLDKLDLDKLDLDKLDLDKLDEILEEEFATLEAELEEMIDAGMEETIQTVAAKVAAVVEETVRKEIAINMLFELNLDMKIVQKATGLTKKELQGLVREINEQSI